MRLAPALLALAWCWFPALAGAQGLESGGLVPPPPAGGGAYEAEPSQTESYLERSEKEDAGRGLQFVWLNGEVGYEYLGLQTFQAKELVDAQFVKSTQSGLLFGGGIGVRLVFITLGARFRLGTFEDWQLWTLDAELGMHIPLGPFEPYFVFGGGYAQLGSFDTNSIDQAGVKVRGFNLRGGAGLDFYPANNFSVGANLSGDLLILTRPKISEQEIDELTADLDPEAADAAAQVYRRDGSSIGGGATLTLVLGLHF